MMLEYKPSYDEYSKILKAAARTGKIKRFKDALESEEFIVIRHDIEFSIDKALAMARIEAMHGVHAAYFVQIESPVYNALGRGSVAKIKEIERLGHDIGLHYRERLHFGKKKNEECIRRQLTMLGEVCERKYELFSTHMPSDCTEYHEYDVPGAINAYAQPFFHRFGRAGRDVLYISDSELHWNYGEPTEETFAKEARVQLLVHPYGWAHSPLKPVETFDTIRAEKTEAAERCFEGEFRPYRELRGRK